MISQYFGAGDERKVHEAVHTSIVLTAAMSVAFTVLGIVITPMTLRMMNTPAEVFPESQAYLTIYFAGMTGLLFYNMGAGILRAVGDSRRPFYFLLVAAALNTGLDLLFVIAFGMGVEGVAYATIIAQFGSAICTTVALLRTDSCVRVRKPSSAKRRERSTNGSGRLDCCVRKWLEWKPHPASIMPVAPSCAALQTKT